MLHSYKTKGKMVSGKSRNSVKYPQTLSTFYSDRIYRISVPRSSDAIGLNTQPLKAGFEAPLNPVEL